MRGDGADHVFGKGLVDVGTPEPTPCMHAPWIGHEIGSQAPISIQRARAPGCGTVISAVVQPKLGVGEREKRSKTINKQ